MSLSTLPRCLKVDCFGFLSIQDLGRMAQLNSSFYNELSLDFIWKSLYPQTFTHAKDSIPQDIQRLVNRPYRRSCIGWSVSVLQTGTDTWLTGQVLDYRNERFLIKYDLDDSEVWERETISGGAWFTAGKLRIRFLSSPPTDMDPPVPSDPKNIGRARAQSFCEDDTSLEMLSGAVLQPKQRKRQMDCSSSCSSRPLSSPRICFDEISCSQTSPGSHSWRCELFRDRTRAPTSLKGKISAHSDEVLCVQFSNLSNRLASSSRDGTTRVFNLVSDCTMDPSIVIQHPPGEIPCRVLWSPDDSLLLVCSEARNGNIFDYDASVSCYDAQSGRRLFSKPNIPFDVCAAWIPNSRVFIYGESLSVSPRGSYHQSLALWDVDSSRVIGRFQFKFINEAFIHLIQVSPDGNFLAVTCGLGDALSDVVRVIRIPEIRPVLEQKSTFTIKVPRMKFSHEILISNSHLSGRKINNIVSIPPSKLISVASPCSDGCQVVPSFFCGGAVLGLAWSRDSRTFYTNTRIYVGPPESKLEEIIDTIPTSFLTERPDLDNTLEIQGWKIDSSSPTCRMKGAHGFTTKDCPFYLFLAESPCGEYVASGSEDCGIYIYHVRHGRLMRVLWNGHEDVVSMVAWNPNGFGDKSCLLASASDDHKICLWASNVTSGEESKEKARRKKQRIIFASG
jgi:WD40 repeat protein